MFETHNGYFRVIDKKTGKVKRFSYDKVTAKERLVLRNNQDDFEIYCDCVPDNSIELKIAANLVIYPVQKNILDKHNPECPKYKSPESRDWTYDSYTKTYRASAYNTAEMYIRRLNQLIFQDSTYTDRFATIKGAYYASKKLSNSYGVRLSSMFNPPKYDRDKEYFVYFFLGQIKPASDDMVEVVCIDGVGSDRISLFADKQEFNKYFGQSQYYVIGENKLPLLIGGWVYLDDQNRLVLTDFWLRATGKNGKLFF